MACKQENEVREKAAAAIQQKSVPSNVLNADNHKQIASTLELTAQQLSGKKGESICMNIAVRDCKGILSMQYSLHWDPQLLLYERVGEFKIPYLSEKNFGLNRTEQGILTSLWYDESLEGISITDGDAIYQVCFQLIGNPGQQATIAFKDEPTPYEVVNIKEQVISFKGNDGLISIQ